MWKSAVNKYSLFMFMIMAMQATAQQTVQFTQYVFNGLAVNPAYAGYKDDLTVNMSYRVQWTGISGAPKTGTVSFDGAMGSGHKNIGLGIVASTDRIGPQNTSSVLLNYAYRLQLDDADSKRLCFGIAFGAVQYKLDASKFNPADPLDYSIPVADESRLSPDLRLGLYFYSPRFYTGASVLNVLQNDVNNKGTNLIRPLRHVYVTAGAMVPLSASVDLKPSVMFKEDFKGPTNMDMGLYVIMDKKFWAGALWRTRAVLWDKPNLKNNLDKDDALAALFQLYVNDRFRIGYSFDFTISKLSRYQNGSHEISIGFSFSGKKERVLSPRFF